MKKLTSVLFASTTFVLAELSHASAVVLFEDSFDRATNNSVNAGLSSNVWTEHEVNTSAVRVFQNNGYGALQLRNIQVNNPPDASVLAGAFSTAGYTNIQVTFEYRATASGNESDDRLYFDWGTTSAVGTINPVGGFHNNSTGVNDFATAIINLGASASDQAAIYLRLFTDVNATSEGYLIRNFKLTGDASPVAAPGETPLPGAAVLFGTVLAGGAGYRSWRNRRRGKSA
jgi:hypothetical protein